VLAADPRIRATLFDQPHVIERAAASFESLGLSSRCQAVGGNFFVSVPEGGDAYLLKSILHDWDDKASIDILLICRKVMGPTSRLLVVERVIGPPNTGPEGKFVDLHMLVVTGGRERTRDEFAALFGQSGFRLLSVTPTSNPLSVIEPCRRVPRFRRRVSAIIIGRRCCNCSGLKLADFVAEVGAEIGASVHDHPFPAARRMGATASTHLH
jgi:hypothetical protein